MRFLLDANMPRCALKIISARGWEGLFLRDMQLGSAPDSVVADLARRHRAVIVTRDFDFADIRNYPPADFTGILVIDLPDHATATDICSLLDSFLSRPTIASDLRGRLAILRAGRVRFRPTLP